MFHTIHFVQSSEFIFFSICFMTNVFWFVFFLKTWNISLSDFVLIEKSKKNCIYNIIFWFVSYGFSFNFQQWWFFSLHCFWCYLHPPPPKYYHRVKIGIFIQRSFIPFRFSLAGWVHRCCKIMIYLSHS